MKSLKVLQQLIGEWDLEVLIEKAKEKPMSPAHLRMINRDRGLLKKVVKQMREDFLELREDVEKGITASLKVDRRKHMTNDDRALTASLKEYGDDS